MNEIKYCRKCGNELNNDNWYPSRQRKYDYICNFCLIKQSKQWRKDNPEAAYVNDHRAKDKRREAINEYARNRSYQKGGKSASDNKSCSLHLGMIAEEVLSKIFENVERMPNGNPGFDFICKNGYKIDVKSACKTMNTATSGCWMFHIRRNQITDYFLCLGFDDRNNYTPKFLLLIPGYNINHLITLTISESTLYKWDKYVLDIDKVITCCNIMKGGI